MRSTLLLLAAQLLLGRLASPCRDEPERQLQTSNQSPVIHHLFTGAAATRPNSTAAGTFPAVPVHGHEAIRGFFVDDRL